MISEIYINNRQNLVKAVGKASYILIGGNGLLSRNSDVPYSFRQDSNLLYLSGVNEPSASILIDNNANKHYIVLPKTSKAKEFFEGKKNIKEILKLSGCDNVISYQDLAKHIKNQKVYFNMPSKTQNWGVFANPFRHWLGRYLHNYGVDFKDVRPYLATMRTIKQPYEITNIKQAITLTKKTLYEIENIIWQRGVTEQHIANEITSIFIKNGARHGYPPVIAFGSNAATLHHLPSLTKIKFKDLVLIDVGAEINNYSADISRTFRQQKDALLEDVKNVQKELISQIKPGNSLWQLHQSSIKLLAEVAKRHKLNAPIKELYPHSVGHHLGLDVHDLADYKLPFSENMVLTIEPGLYSKKLGFGYRVEDDVLVTEKGSIVL